MTLVCSFFRSHQGVLLIFCLFVYVFFQHQIFDLVVFNQAYVLYACDVCSTHLFFLGDNVLVEEASLVAAHLFSPCLVSSHDMT